jgi:hypothetical protein
MTDEIEMLAIELEGKDGSVVFGWYDWRTRD